jgi:hypothetical protein
VYDTYPSQQILAFTPGGADDPMSLAFPNFANIHGVWLPAPTTAVSFQVPGLSGWTTIYQITAVGGVFVAEAIPFDMDGMTQMRIVGNGSGALMYVFVLTYYIAPYKAVIT